MMKKIFSLAILFPIAIHAFAQMQTPPAGGKPKDFKLPEKNVSKLANGLTSTMVQYGNLPKAQVSLIVKTGNIHEGANEVWLGDLTGNFMKEGTQSMTFKQISKKVAAMGGEISINTAMDNVVISGSVLSEFVPDLVKVIADVVMNPAFPAKELDRLKSDLKRQLTVEKAVPQSQASEKFFQIIYKNHPYGRYFPTESMISSFTLDMVKGFYSKNFGAKRSVIYIVGMFDESAAREAIDGSLGKWKPGPEVSYPPATATRTNEIALIDRKDAPQTTVLLGLPTLTPKHKDVVALQVTNSLLGGSFGSRITTNIREDKGYTYSPFSTIQNRKTASIWYEQADVTSEHTGESLQEISKEINRLQKEPPSKEELEGIQKFMAGTFVLQNSNPGGIINQLHFLDLYELDDNYLTNRVKNIYAVTPEKVSQIAKDHFKYDSMTMVLVGDKKLIDQQMNKLKLQRK